MTLEAGAARSRKRPFTCTCTSVSMPTLLAVAIANCIISRDHFLTRIETILYSFGLNVAVTLCEQPGFSLLFTIHLHPEFVSANLGFLEHFHSRPPWQTPQETPL